MFDLAKRFALLEPDAGAGAIECVRVGAEGRSRACPRCDWRMLTHETECENCGLAHAASTETEIVALPAPRITIDAVLACTNRDALDARLLALRPTCRARQPGAEVPGRFALRVGPKRFRREVRSLLEVHGPFAGADCRIDVVCSTPAAPRWTAALADCGVRVRVHTPRGLADTPLRAGSVLVIDTRAALRFTSATHRALRVATHATVIARAPERRIGDPDPMFALTDLVAPATFATLHEARALHHHDRATFLHRRDAVVLDDVPRATEPGQDAAPGTTTPRRAFLVLTTSTGFSPVRRIVTVVVTATSASVAPGEALFFELLESRSLDASPVTLDPTALDALVSEPRTAAAHHLTRALTRLASAYAQRVDATPAGARTAIAREFATRSTLLIDHAAVNVCIAPLASVTIRTDPSHAAR